MKTTRELYDGVLQSCLNEPYFTSFKYKKKDKNFVQKTDAGFNAIEFQVHDGYDLKRDFRAMQVKPLYFMRFDVLHKWFEKYSFKTLSDQRNNYVLIFSGSEYQKKKEYHFLLDERNYANDVQEFVADVVSNAQACFGRFQTLQAVYDYIIPPVLSGEKALPNGQADWIFEYLTLCRIVAPENYEVFKKMVLERIEFILSGDYKDINIMQYYPNLDAILKDMESQF